jgi:hypothetical protein
MSDTVALYYQEYSFTYEVVVFPVGNIRRPCQDPIPTRVTLAKLIQKFLNISALLLKGIFQMLHIQQIQELVALRGGYLDLLKGLGPIHSWNDIQKEPKHSHLSDIDRGLHSSCWPLTS